MEMTNFTVVREVLHINYWFHWFLSRLGSKPKKFDFVHQTVSRWEAHTGWSCD